MSETRRGRAAAAAAAALMLAASLTTSACSFKLPGGIIEPAITPSSLTQGSTVVERRFTFEDSEVTLKVPVDKAVYAGAVSAPKSAVLIGDVPPSKWVPAYYRAFIEEPHQVSFYDAALDALHEARAAKALDDSRYAEMVIAMVQTMEYRTDSVDLAPKFPIETFGDGFGDCDDKALLVAGLLARDGYDVCILLFEAEKHVALGLRAPGIDYKATGYAYVELTRPSLVGTVPDGLAGGIRLSSSPEVIRIGEGTTSYGRASDVLFIERKLADMRATMKALEARITSEKSGLAARRASLDAEKVAAEALSDPEASRAAATRYNERAAAYNASVEQLDTLITRYNALVDVEKYVANHHTSRPQVYERLKSVKL